jgi:endonuclease/exonuclease/phosphatase (EEP) superfamily protein YafD
MTATESLLEETEAEEPKRVRVRLRARLLLYASLAWALFLVCHVLLIGRWWLWMFVEPMPPLLLVVVPLLLLVLVPIVKPQAKWLVVAVLGAALAAGVPFAGFNPTALSGGSPHQPGVPVVKVLSWNTGYWDSGTGYKDFRGKDSTEALYAYLKQHRADVYLLSEHLYWKNGPIELHDEAELRREFPGYQVNVEGELVTISRLPVVATHPRADDGSENAWYWHGNKAQRTDIRVGDRVMSVYNVHIPQPIDPRLNPLTPKYYSFAHYQWTRQQREVDALRADLAHNPNPLLIAGDFNSPWMGGLVRLGDGIRTLNPTQGSVLPLTWPVPGSGWGLMPRLWRLDWAFTKGGVNVASYRFLTNSGLSDHMAQEFSVSLPGSRDTADGSGG